MMLRIVQTLAGRLGKIRPLKRLKYFFRQRGSKILVLRLLQPISEMRGNLTRSSYLEKISGHVQPQRGPDSFAIHRAQASLTLTANAAQPVC